ncbi:MAG: tRNA (adenosine(37)-N6)-threonylcarbamoyltransferase complex ATPase subunit type 1 TsaE [Rhizobiaceae bacterium]|nr:tRNA (adenosine(37)-N6)-threonylcarbamoyltransferase complex ATPase subunit type 1 TsaE [Rhizobiaceae bacterium]
MAICVTTQNQVETEHLGAELACGLKAGDLVLLSGDLGVGKSTLARAIIRQIAENEALEVPSPTYTICQAYDARFPVFHYDLYRISRIDELDELGWSEQLETGCVLMEWPQNVFDKIPENAILIQLDESGENAREIKISGPEAAMMRLERSFEIREFMAAHGYKNQLRRFLTGDASSRAYETIGEEKLILMNSPAMTDGPPVLNGKPYSQIARLAEDVSAFVAIAKTLREHGFRAPEILAKDLESGLLVTENLGAQLIIDEKKQPIPERYMSATALLAEVHQERFEKQIDFASGRKHTISTYDVDVMMIEAGLFKDWYLPHETDGGFEEAQFTSIWEALIEKAQHHPSSLVLRDYHSPNIIWLEGDTPKEQIGLIDFQDALIGPEAYDVASLAQDARVDVSERLENQLVDHYISVRKSASSQFDETVFRESYAIMSALRTTKILGIFIRLDIRDGKPQYRSHLPRMKEYLKRSLNHSILSEYRDWLETVIKL